MKLVSQAVHKIVIFLSRRLFVIRDNILPSTIVCTMILGTGMYKKYKAGLPINLSGVTECSFTGTNRNRNGQPAQGRRV
jgi:hypothetical protein